MNIKLQKRNNNNAKIRKEGNVPVSVYGKGIRFSDLMTDAHEMSKVVQATGLHYTSTFLTLEIDNKQYQALMKEVSLHPVNGSILHVDFFIPKDIFMTTVPIFIDNIELCSDLKAKTSLIVPNKRLNILNTIGNFRKEIRVNIGDLHKGRLFDLSTKEIDYKDGKFINLNTKEVTYVHPGQIASLKHLENLVNLSDEKLASMQLNSFRVLPYKVIHSSDRQFEGIKFAGKNKKTFSIASIK
jgi:ribosomal protein L25 (general stress protein Ctc)